MVDTTGQCLDLLSLFSVLFDGGWIEVHTGRASYDQGNSGNGADNSFLLSAEVLIREDQDDQRQEGDNADDQAQLILDEEAGFILFGCWIQAVGLFSEHISDDSKDQCTDNESDQPAHFYRWFPEDHDGPDLNADRSDPGEDGNHAEVFRLAFTFR